MGGLPTWEGPGYATGHFPPKHGFPVGGYSDFYCDQNNRGLSGAYVTFVTVVLAQRLGSRGRILVCVCFRMCG